MKYDDFAIGQYFYTASGKWQVVDIGTRTIIAHKVRITREYRSWDEENNIVFYPYDFGGCRLTEKE